ncbi:hypothetical protein [Kordiimonas lacus]|uniref:Uncharacterized protein n=1 Tax=Kordiimonas lacus TaxID=637679 RepID=A0A1G6UBV9_9PROT|nr:hypothetical protein [Kordiimonas lacus]SDD38783.1 hypothetical protein SAMN04488071_0538 [Kordiimonas lacus]
MKKLLLAATLLLIGGLLPATAQEEEPASIEMPLSIEMEKPITMDVTYKMEQGPVSLTARETMTLTPLRTEGEQVIYRYKSLDSEFLDLQGMPPLFSNVLVQITDAAQGITYEYAADNTGYPLELTETKNIRKVIKQARKSLQKWAKSFAKENGLNKQQQAQVVAVTEQSLLEAFPEEDEALAAAVLEQGQMVFYGTGRSLYLDYYTEFNTTRYFAPGQATFHTIDSWQVVSYDEEKSEAVIRFDQYLNDEEFKGFLERLKPVLMEQNGPAQEAAVDALVEKYRLLQLNRQGEYVIDLVTGLPMSGTIRSEEIFDGNTEVETIEFTTKY